MASMQVQRLISMLWQLQISPARQVQPDGWLDAPKIAPPPCLSVCPSVGLSVCLSVCLLCISTS